MRFWEPGQLAFAAWDGTNQWTDHERIGRNEALKLSVNEPVYVLSGADQEGWVKVLTRHGVGWIVSGSMYRLTLV